MKSRQPATLEGLGIRPLINASGTLTSLGGTRLRACAMHAMAEVGPLYVDLEQLHRAAGERIAGLLGVEAACITVSASAGIVQAVAACLAGSDPARQERLPDPPHKNRILLQTSHRNPFDRCLKVAGGEIILVGDAIHTYPHELEAAIDERSAAVAYFLQANMLDASLDLDATLEIAHRHGLPVIVDAAAELPPKSNLWALAQAGADLVIFSGGKDIGGPQSSGLLVGRRDLVEAAFEQSAPYELVVARSMKAGKETVAGLLAALEEYLQEDESARFQEWERIAAYLLEELNAVPGLSARRLQPSQPKIQPATVPRLAVHLEPGAPLTLPELAARLRSGDPPIAVERTASFFWINTHTLIFDEATILVKKLDQLMGGEYKR
jgi:L-seryl-tRNA(Ser) seleniumtransferase